jgi:hypothetical protein
VTKDERIKELEKENRELKDTLDGYENCVWHFRHSGATYSVLAGGGSLHLYHVFYVENSLRERRYYELRGKKDVSIERMPLGEKEENNE